MKSLPFRALNAFNTASSLWTGIGQMHEFDHLYFVAVPISVHVGVEMSSTATRNEQNSSICPVPSYETNCTKPSWSLSSSLRLQWHLFWWRGFTCSQPRRNRARRRAPPDPPLLRPTIKEQCTSWHIRIKHMNSAYVCYCAQLARTCLNYVTIYLAQ